MKRKTSLYECLESRYPADDEGLVLCRAGHQLGNYISARQVKRGQPLECTTCQGCKNFIRMGKPIPAYERGWIK